MAETIYTYTISTDTTNGKVENAKLREEIAGTATITISLNRIDTSGDELFIVFNDELPNDSVDDQVAILTALVLAHDGISAVTVQAVRIQETALAARRLMIRGIRFVADINDTTNYDVSFDEDRELQNVEVYVEKHTSGDYLELFVVHPVYGVVGQFAETVFIPPDGRITPDDGFDTSTLPAGLMVRFVYTSVATTGDQPIIICHLRTHK